MGGEGWRAGEGIVTGRFRKGKFQVRLDQNRRFLIGNDPTSLGRDFYKTTLIRSKINFF